MTQSQRQSGFGFKSLLILIMTNVNSDITLLTLNRIALIGTDLVFNLGMAGPLRLTDPT